MKSDSQIQQDILRELRWDHRVKETEIGVGVDRGIVTLSGTVSSYAKRVAAAEATHRVAGVLDVANDIVAALPGTSMITDTDIASAIRSELQWNVFIPAEQIRTTVSKGWVTLEGTVEMVGQREEAEKAIRNLEGICGITNNITVRRQKIDAGTVKSAIEEALERRAEREAARIGVEVHDCIVTLTGRVHSVRERMAVVGAAGQAPGIEAVIDNLHIDPIF
jgi:osmotically-inducible protein OsmY